jgi:predicted transcriptional regulator
MTHTIACALVVLLAIVVGVLTWASETPADRARRWHSSGISQTRIADRLGVTRYRVRCWVA